MKYKSRWHERMDNCPYYRSAFRRQMAEYDAMIPEIKRTADAEQARRNEYDRLHYGLQTE